MADYTPFDPHEYELNNVTLSTQRNNHSVNITNVVAEIEIFEHIERAYITGSITFSDNSRVLEIMDFQGTEFVDISLKLYQSPYKVQRRFVVRELTSVVPSTDTTDVITLSLIDYDSYFNALINVNKMYEGKPGEIINDILRDVYGTRKVAQRAGEDNILDEKNWDASSEIPEAAAAAITKTNSFELQSSFRYIVPNLSPLEAIEVIKKRSTGLTGAPFFCWATLADNNFRFFDLYTLVQAPPVNVGDPYIYSTELAQSAGGGGANISRLISEMTVPQNANTLDLIRNGDVGALYEFMDTTHGLEFNLGYDLQKVLENLLQVGSYPAVDTRRNFNNKPLSEYRAKRVHKIATANTYYDARNIYEESSAQKHAAKAVQKSLRNLLGKSMLEITVPGVHMLPQNSSKTIGRNITVVSTADIEKYNEIFDRKRSGDYMIYAARHKFSQTRYTTGLSLVKIANFKGNTSV